MAATEDGLAAMSPNPASLRHSNTLSVNGECPYEPGHLGDQILTARPRQALGSTALETQMGWPEPVLNS